MKLTDRLARLVDVKSIMTLMLTAVFCILTLRGTVSVDQFLTILTVVISFYFGTKKGQDRGDKND